jgi:hypothetical protein
MDQRTVPSRSRTTLQWAVGFSLLLLVVAGDAPRASSADPAAERFLAAREEPLTQYRAYRRLHARSEKFGQEAWMEAWTELDRQGFRYTVVSEKGSDYIRNKVLRVVLNREQEMVAAGDCGRSELTSDNYAFEAAPRAMGEQYVLIKPKRKDVLLVDGRMVLSGDGTELLRVEGRLSKNPSFWTSLVNVIRHYARLDGVRVPIATETTAKVKLAGEAQLDVRYEYETINGRPVSLSARRAALSVAAGQLASAQ